MLESGCGKGKERIGMGPENRSQAGPAKKHRVVQGESGYLWEVRNSSNNWSMKSIFSCVIPGYTQTKNECDITVSVLANDPLISLSISMYAGWRRMLPENIMRASIFLDSRKEVRSFLPNPAPSRTVKGKANHET